MRSSICFLIMLCLVACAPSTGFSQSESANEFTPAHHTKDGFKNPHIEDPQKSFFSFFKMRFFSEEGKQWADHASLADTVPVTAVELDGLHTANGSAIQLTWLGHSMFLIQYQGINILTDPIFSDRASPFGFAGPKRYVPHVVDYEKLPPIDWVVISHNHYDHLDLATLSGLGKNTRFLLPLNNLSLLEDVGITVDRVTELDWHESTVQSAVTFTALPSQHWSARGIFDRHKMLWASWLIAFEDKKIWFAGDTGYNAIQFKDIGQRHPNIDVALIPIGAYLPRSFMRFYHVNPTEAVQIHQDIGANQSVGMHWGTFPLTAEAPIAPVNALNKVLDQKPFLKAHFTVMKIGETRRF